MHETPPSPDVPSDLVARTLRHEVGDLLQSVYSTVAIMQRLLPPDAERERRLLADLRLRAEICRDQIDAAHDLLRPHELDGGPHDLVELAVQAAAAVLPRFPGLDTGSEAGGPLPVEADGRRLGALLTLLLRNACQAARKRVRARAAAAAEGEVEWVVCYDAAAPSPDLLAWLERPFPAVSEARYGLGLSLARHLMELHRGRVEVTHSAEDGCRVRLVLPRAAG
jgi:signal transduction histidine kinase